METINADSIVDITSIKRYLAAICDEMEKYKDEYDAVPPPESFTAARKLLDKKEYNVVVCGEAKQGKSSLINALIGQDLLPVDCKIATNRIFRISNAAKQRIQLVFDDGTQRDITAKEMVRYGTETDMLLSDDPVVNGKKILFVDVEVPAPFLPEGIHVLDTPGLGGLVEEHTQITYGCLAAADAVVFVKEANRPVTSEERACVSEILAATPNVMFVLSKVDLKDRAQREELISRCGEIMTDAFGKAENRQFKFWPVSAKLMREAGEDENYVEMSGFSDLMNALEKLFERTSGYVATELAYKEAHTYWLQTDSFRAERLKSIFTSGGTALNDVLSKKEEEKKNLVNDWDDARNRNNKRSDLMCEISNCLSREEALLRDAIDPNNGEVSREMRRMIVDLRREREFREFDNNIPCRVTELWAGCRTRIQSEALQAIGKLLKELEDVTGKQFYTEPVGKPSSDSSEGDKLGARRKTGGFWRRLSQTRMGAISGVAIGGVLGGVAAAVIAIMSGGTAIPVAVETFSLSIKGGAVIGSLLGGGVGALATWRETGKNIVFASRQDLETRIRQYIGSIRHKFTTPISMDTESPMKQLIAKQKDQTIEFIDLAFQDKLNQLTEEIDRLNADKRALGQAKEGLRTKLSKLDTSLKAIKERLGPVYDFLVKYASSPVNAF